jgi:hypothetical protein
MARPHVVDGGNGLQIWMAAANILNKRREHPRRGGPPAWVSGVRLTIPHRKKAYCYEMFYRASDLDEFSA